MNKPPKRQTSGGEGKAFSRRRTKQAPDIDVRRIRVLMRMSQAMFAHLFAISVGTLRHWEAGERRPSGPARVLLHVIARHPAAVRVALKSRVWRWDEQRLLPGVTDRESPLPLGGMEDESVDPPPETATTPPMPSPYAPPATNRTPSR